MDWGFLDIFKKAEFNTLMLAVAITGWILYLLVPMNIYILGAAILASAYCVIRLIVYTYQYFSVKRANKRYEEQKKKEEESKQSERREARNIEISRMFEGLKEESKNSLAYILLKGKSDSRNYNVLHFDRYSKDSSYLSQAVNVSKIFRDALGDGQDCIWIRHYTDTLAATIDPFLYDLIKQYIDNNGLELRK